MQALPRWRNALILKKTLFNSYIGTSTTSSSSFLATNYASFHSSAPSFEKWETKWNSDIRGQQPSKTYIRYAVRQKRADTKKALKDLLFNSGASTIKFEGTDDRWDAEHLRRSDKKERIKASGRRSSKVHQKRMKSKYRRETCEEFDEHPETVFQATFGNKWYTWAFKSWNESFGCSSSSDFDWREQSKWNSRKHRSWEEDSEVEVDESRPVGTSSQRTILGLPPKGPLKLEDVKNAFRISALKWHPDKHQGPSQAMAEEKFKHCVDAYKSICSALSSA